ncbi:Multifunctional pyrimidine synthesis protein CAD [Cerrena zonata]|uniref:Multifunctional pyrimidine synthesis protein CAD n=1 Tax=Cerrena zonata TaxID=2478898 RepID=A0AAW0FKI4_9APHY
MINAFKNKVTGTSSLLKLSTRYLASAANSSFSKTSQLDRATLTIKDGPVFNGYSFGANKNISGEAVFTTSLVGYPESMTDPSYKGQILCFTQPLIGNYGVPSSTLKDQFNLLKYMESPSVQCIGIVVADVALEYSHWTAVESLQQWCQRSGVAAISGVDTRQLVSYLRDKGSSLAKITIGEEYDADEDAAFEDPDCGAKENILRCLVQRGHQLLALASGAKTIKLKAHNIPALDLITGKCHITSQNHGYAVDTSTLSEEWEPYFTNLNDLSNEETSMNTNQLMV